MTDLPASETQQNPVPTTVGQSPSQNASVSKDTPQLQKNKWVIPFVILVMVLAIGIAGFFAYQNYQLQQLVQKQTTASPESTSPPPTTDPTASWKNITLSSLSFKIPTDWNYTKCSGDNFIYLGSNIPTSRTSACEFDSQNEDLTINVTTDPRLMSIPSNTSPDDLYTENRTNIIIDGQTATQQQETVRTG